MHSTVRLTLVFAVILSWITTVIDAETASVDTSLRELLGVEKTRRLLTYEHQEYIFRLEKVPYWHAGVWHVARFFECFS